MSLMQSIRDSEPEISAAASLASPEKISPPKNSLPEISPCPTCRGIVFWESIYRDGVFRCEVCEVPPSPRMIGRRIGVGGRPGDTHPGGTAGVVEGGGGVATGPGESAPDSDEAREARLRANQASGNVTGNDWADARRRGRLSTLVESRGEIEDDDGRVIGGTSAVGYPQFVNLRFSRSSEWQGMAAVQK